MKKNFHYTLSSLALLFMSVTLLAQQDDTQSLRHTVDSLQRVWMKANLNVTELAIDQVFSFRNNLLNEINGIRKNASLNQEQQDSAALAARQAAEAAIKTALGPLAYELYTDRIRQRLRQTGQPGAQPLTGVGN
ncbi:hypothetical protein LZZ85_27415 [Terrimonas sp. NA20]|uniref:Uncharacterized protein n=1 Tax=Terrimonas ginsenosidimutans TaxID=2908004 RepID=A0ABS9L0G2_9BACT|nr:hypothetical protein [Terrimonas ginsenosidimutans]MCG2618063.1 hypothetical protein [Terrimonas ginsenosidimutans]